MVAWKLWRTLALAGATMLAVPVPVAAAQPVSAFFLDGWASTVPNALGFIGSEGTIVGHIDEPRNLFVEATGPGGAYLSLQVVVPQDQTVGAGNYTTGVGGARVWVFSDAGNQCYADGMPGSVTITELESANGLATKLAASFDIKCGSADPIRGVVRINSTAPFSAVRIMPRDHTFGGSHSFGTVPIGESSDPWTGSIENVGTEPIAVSASIGGSAFKLDPGACTGTLAVGATCSVSARFAPLVGGEASAELHLATPGLSITDRTWTLTGIAEAPTETLLEVDTDSPNDFDPTAALYTITTTPEASGIVTLTIRCGTEVITRYGSAGPGGASPFGWWVPTPAGACTAQGTFTDGVGWLASESDVVSFQMPLRAAVHVNASSPDFVIEGAPVTVTATVAAGNGPVPDSGSLTIVDQDSDVTLVSGEISALDHDVASTRSDWTPGTHHLFATFAGGPGFGITSKEFDLVVDEDRSIPEPQLVSPGFTTDVVVPLQTVAFDTPVPPVEKQLSNDGVHWASFPYSISHDWSLIDPATGGVDVDGPHTVYAKYRDRAGNWSPVVSRVTVLDRQTPVVSDTQQTPAAGGSLVSTGLPVKLSWTGSDPGSGLDHYELQRSTDGGPWSTVAKTTSTTYTVGVASSHTYRFRARALDRAGNAATGAASTSVSVTGISDRSSKVTYTASWRSASSSAYSGGTAHYSKSAGAKASVKVTGRGFTWIASRGPTRGSARVYVNGTLVKTVSLYSATTSHRQLVYRLGWSTSTTRTVTIKVVGTAGHPRVDIDALYVWR